MGLFLTDAELKSRTRLSSVPATSPDTLAIIADCIMQARAAFYRRLGRSRVAELQAITSVAEPSTDDEVLRSMAERAEVDLTYVALLRRLPNAFMDASGDLQKRWNEEAPFRERPRMDLRAELQRLEAQIEEDMQMLAEEEELGDESDVRVYDGTPDFTAPLPGESLLGRITRFPLSED